MAITVNADTLEPYRLGAGQTDTNEVIYKLNSAMTYVVECTPTVPGSASLKLSTDTNEPADFSMMALANQGTQSAAFARQVRGCTYVGLDVSSGTWSVKVRRA